MHINFFILNILEHYNNFNCRVSENCREWNISLECLQTKENSIEWWNEGGVITKLYYGSLHAGKGSSEEPGKVYHTMFFLYPFIIKNRVAYVLRVSTEADKRVQ